MAEGTNSTESTLQWIRACSLVVADSSGKGLELGDFRIIFATHKGDIETPNSAEIRIYNLAEQTVSRMRKEFTRVVLQAGYQGNMGVIFSGSIRQARTGRESGTDTWLELIAADGDRAYNFATVNTTLAAGSRPSDRVRALIDTMGGKDAEAGDMVGIDAAGNALPRGKVQYGMTRKYMRAEADNTDTTWSIQDGRVQMVPRKGCLPGEAVVLTHETGLVGTPEQTDQGITCRCLINPRLRICGRIQLANQSIQRAKTDLKQVATMRPKIAADGLYRVIKIEYFGDTRGADWYADITCIGMDDTASIPLDMI